HSILYVGVRRLPEMFSPATAWTDAEKEAVELLFEGLVEAVHGKGVERFEPRLAARLPAAPEQALPGWTRTFPLRRDAYFSDGQRVSSVDVRHTVLLLSDPQRPGRDPAWSAIVEVPRVEGGSFNVPLHLRQRSIEPLSLLSFKILPQQYGGKPLTRAVDSDFARKPVGSGPYRFVERRTEKGRAYLVLIANAEAERSGQHTSIREVQFLEWQSPRDLKALP